MENLNYTIHKRTNMEAFLKVCVLLGILSFKQVSSMLICIECTHIIWDGRDRSMHVRESQGQALPSNGGSTWIQSIDQMLRARFSPACASPDPLNWNIARDPTYSQGSNYPVVVPLGEAVCPAFSTTERCNFLYGAVVVKIQQYDKTIKLHMYIRNCQSVDNRLENMCYERDTRYGSFTTLKNFFQDSLSFFGPGVVVDSFYGRQCICNGNKCSNYTQGSASVSVSMVTLLVAMLAYFGLKG